MPRKCETNIIYDIIRPARINSGVTISGSDGSTNRGPRGGLRGPQGYMYGPFFFQFSPQFN